MSNIPVSCIDIQTGGPKYNTPEWIYCYPPTRESFQNHENVPLSFILPESQEYSTDIQQFPHYGSSFRSFPEFLVMPQPSLYESHLNGKPNQKGITRYHPYKSPFDRRQLQAEVPHTSPGYLPQPSLSQPVDSNVFQEERGCDDLNRINQYTKTAGCPSSCTNENIDPNESSIHSLCQDEIHDMMKHIFEPNSEEISWTLEEMDQLLELLPTENSDKQKNVSEVSSVAKSFQVASHCSNQRGYLARQPQNKEIEKYIGVGPIVSSTTPAANSDIIKTRCDVCDKVFIKPCYLTQHNKIHHSGEKPFKCSRCGKRFSKETPLKDHIKKHEGDKPHKCEICPKMFNHKADLKRHIVSCHTDSKPFTCTTCGKGFVRKDHMMRHANTHTRKKSECLQRKVIIRHMNKTLLMFDPFLPTSQV